MLLSMSGGKAESHTYPAQLHGISLYGIIHLYVTNNFHGTIYHTAIQTNPNPQPPGDSKGFVHRETDAGCGAHLKVRLTRYSILF